MCITNITVVVVVVEDVVVVVVVVVVIVVVASSTTAAGATTIPVSVSYTISVSCFISDNSNSNLCPLASSVECLRD